MKSKIIIGMICLVLLSSIMVYKVNINKSICYTNSKVDTEASSQNIIINADSEMTLQKVLYSAKSGDTIIIDGTITSDQIEIKDKITLQGINNAKIDFSLTSEGRDGIIIKGNNVTIQDMEICNSGGRGIYIGSGNNELLNLNVNNNGECGVVLGVGAYNNYLYKVNSNNNAINSSSVEKGNGFLITYDSSSGSVFEECIAEYNYGNGFECFGTTGAIKFISCKANYNGQSNKEDLGNGFKLGGIKDSGHDRAYYKSDLDSDNHELIGCSAEGNSANGFERGSQNGEVTMNNCTADGNNGYNFNWPNKTYIQALDCEVEFDEKAKIINCNSFRGLDNLSGAEVDNLNKEN